MMMAAAALIRDAQRTNFRIDGAAVGGPLFKQLPGLAARRAARWSIENLSNQTLEAVVSSVGVPIVPEPAGGYGFTIERHYYTPDGEETDIATIGAERSRRGAADGHRRRQPPGQDPHRRPDPGRLRDREPEHLGKRRDVRLRLAPGRAEHRAYRGAHRPLRRGARPQRRRSRCSSASPIRCAPCRRAPSPSRRPRSRTCTAQATKPTAAPERSRWSARRGSGRSPR